MPPKKTQGKKPAKKKLKNIVKTKKGYRIRSATTGKLLPGTYKTEEEASVRRRQIYVFKHKLYSPAERAEYHKSKGE